MEERKDIFSEAIDLRLLAKKIWAGRRQFYKALPIVFVLSCLYIVSLPRYYRSDIKLAPEMGTAGTESMLGSLASSFGFDLSDMQTSDAITPLLYPDLMEDNGFIASLMKIRVEDEDGEIKATYHDYLKNHQKKAWWSYPIGWLSSLLPKKQDKRAGKGNDNPYYIPKAEGAIYEKARNNIDIRIDKKNGVITISAKAQDALIAKTLADSVKEKLQLFITDYRTNKARTDYEYYKKLTSEALQDYQKARKQYSSMSDASTNLSLRSVMLKLEDIENDMQLKYNTYTTLNTQLQAANAKVQERTPAFTVIKGASVPYTPAGPKRMLFVIGMVLLASIVICVRILLKEGRECIVKNE